MALTITKGVNDLLAEANARVETLSPEEARAASVEPGVLLVDLRDVRELERDGMIPDAFHAPRGMLEFWIDPASPYHKQELAEADRLILYCASGWRSALSAATLRDMGLDAVAHIGGGFNAWKAAGGAVAERPKKA